MGHSGQRAHDDRYVVAEDYMQVVYKLWGGKLGGRRRRRRRSERDVHAARARAEGPSRRSAFQARRAASQRALAAAHASALSSGLLAGGPRLRGASRRMRVSVGPLQEDHRAARRGDPQARRRGGPRLRGHPDVRDDDGHRRADRRRGAGEALGVQALRRPRRRADADVGLDRRRFLPLRSRFCRRACRQRGGPQRAREHHARRSGPALDGARGRRACLDWRH